MEKLFHSTFDFFNHALPGFCIVISLFILDPNLNTAQDFIAKANEIQIGGGIFLLIIGYIVGFGIHPIGRFMYIKLGFKIWKEKIKNDVPIFIAEKYIMVREFSPRNFKYIETWNMFCAMSHNLAIASLFSFTFTILKISVLKVANIGFWFSFALISLFLFFIFLYRAVKFSIWAADDLNACVAKLKFIERTELFDKKQERDIE